MGVMVSLILSLIFSLLQYKQAHHKQSKQEFDKVRLRQDLTGTHLVSEFVISFQYLTATTSGCYLVHGVLNLWAFAGHRWAGQCCCEFTLYPFIFTHINLIP